MSKMRVFGVVLAAAAGVVIAGSGLATAGAAPSVTVQPGISVQPVIGVGEPDPSGTGSSSALVDLIKSLTTGSAGAK